METGRIVKSRNSFFYAETPGGMITCRLRGNLRRTRRGAGAVCPGDIVGLSLLPDGTGIVERVQKRRNLLLRPAVANIDQAVLVFAAAQPDPHPLLANRFLAMAERSGIPRIVLCVSKMDLAQGEPAPMAGYEALYPVLRVSARDGTGLDALRELLPGKVTVFAGPSGVGKSSLLNAVEPGLSLATGTVSERIKRGRHTTRMAELLPYHGGYVADTPGFSLVETGDLSPAELAACFPEFAPLAEGCRFSPCSHSHEPSCAVKEALQEGRILPERYAAYLAMLEEIRGRRLAP